MYDKPKIKSMVATTLDPIFVALLRFGVKPIHITVCGSVLVIFGCGLLLNNELEFAFGVLLLGGLCDVIDGAYARQSSQVTRFGGFCDSVSDRYNEFFLVGCVLFLYRDNEILYYFSFVFFLGVGLMSYTRALFDKNQIECPANPFEYLERGILFLLFLCFGRLDLWLILIAVGTHSFILIRVYRFYELCQREGSPGI